MWCWHAIGSGWGFFGVNESFERGQCSRLLNAETELCDLASAFDVTRTLNLPPGPAPLLGAPAIPVSKRETVQPKTARKRAHGAVPSRSGGSPGGCCFFRHMFGADEQQVVERMVIPNSGTKTLVFNGKTRTRTLRRRLWLEDRARDAQCFRPSANHTLLTLQQRVWWPGMEPDYQAWVASCHACHASKPHT